MREGLIGFFLLLLLFLPFYFRGVSSSSYAVVSLKGEPVATASGEEMLGVAEAEVEYSLPYPGILPDHPLYLLKVLRDRILEALIRDPVRKAEFYLLMADKRLNMGLYLTEKEKPELAETTVSKGEKYMVKGVDELVRISAEQDNLDIENLTKKYKTALLKHEQVIKDLQIDIPENIIKGYDSSLKIVNKQTERIDEIEIN